ncbi:MAG: hypothetical protein Q9166_002595 [cf. Caloplaca sp. 2 TL-2023]
MDVLEQDPDEGHQASHSPPHQVNGRHNQTPIDTESENQLHSTATSKQPTPQPNGDSTSRPNSTSNSQTNGIPDAHTPPSGQSSTTEKENVINPKDPLEPFAWDDLEQRFVQKIEECQRQEVEIQKDFREWCHVFQAWASTAREYEEERLHKRLKTRMAWVQHAETTLEEKRQHYIKVVQAFESALALLGGL